ncbi:hypothetical protein ACFQZV_04985 [Microbacterium koreense]|uniref:Uncharacterized protein n=1 Tax=Microbacterium koreense TaxID=323761 RepID=A0ABW2ZQ20_9MICO
MRTRSRLVATMLAVATSVTLLTGCGILASQPAPTSTVRSADGESVVISWEDYPAHAGVDGERLLGAPDAAELEGPARGVMDAVRGAVQDESGVPLHPLTPTTEWFGIDDWFPQQGNGYGGDSMLTSVNCCDLQSDAVPTPDRWDAVFAAANAALVEAGLGALTEDQALDDEYRDTYCTGAGGTCWLRSMTAYDGYQWVFVTIQDTTLDPTGDAAREAEEMGWPLASIAVGYGATVVDAGRSDEFAAAIAPFVGLERPDATTSD